MLKLEELKSLCKIFLTFGMHPLSHRKQGGNGYALLVIHLTFYLSISSLIDVTQTFMLILKCLLPMTKCFTIYVIFFWRYFRDVFFFIYSHSYWNLFTRLYCTDLYNLRYVTYGIIYKHFLLSFPPFQSLFVASMSF